MSSMGLEVTTPERVKVTLPIAGIGYRTLAYLIDAALIFAFWVVLYFAFTLLRTNLVDVFQALSGAAQTVSVVALFFTQWVYWTASEVFLNGQTLGKRAMHIRVVRQDGSPAGVYESAVRNLCRVIDFLPGFYAAGVTCMLATSSHQRLGDLLAGTVLVHEETVDLDKYTTAGAAIRAEATLTPQDIELILGYLERAASLAPDARQRLSASLIDRYAAGVSSEERTQLRASVEAAENFLKRRARTEHKSDA